MISIDGLRTDFKKVSYFLSLFAVTAFDNRSAVLVNLTLNLFCTALYANAIARCVLPTICKALHIVGYVKLIDM